MHFHLSLNRKIILWAFLPAVAVLVLVALINFQAYQRVTEELVVQRNRELVRLLAGKVSTRLVELIHSFEVFSDELTLHAGDEAWMKDRAGLVERTFPAFDGGVLAYGFSEGFRPVYPAPVDFSDPEQNRSLVAQVEMRLRTPDDTMISDLVLSPGTGKDFLAFCVPYRGGGSVLIGLSRVGSNEEAGFNSLAASLNLGSRSTVYLVDGNGLVLYHTQPEEIGKDYSNDDFVQAVMAGKTGSLRTRDAAGADLVVSYAPVLGTRWGLVIQENWSTLVGSSRGYMAILLVLLALGVVLPAAIVGLGVRRITQPVRALTEASRAVAGGNFGQAVEARTGDEIEELAEQFNCMSRQLQASYATLEQRVADRTRELMTVNSVAAVVSGTLDLGEILRLALEKTVEALEVECGAVLLVDESGERLLLAGEHGFSPSFLEQIAALPKVEGAAGEAYRSGGPVLRRLEDYPDGSLRAAVEAEGLKLVVSIPIQAKGKPLGVMNLCARQERPVSAEELDMLVAIGRQVGLGIENARLFSKAEELAVAAERSRLARELHDAVTQTLFSTSLMAEVLPRVWEADPEAGRAQAEEIRQMTKGALGEMRSLLIELRPQALVEADFKDLLRHLVDAFRGRELIPVRLSVAGACDLPPDVKVALYRITQEVLNNIAKHAEAGSVSIEVACETGMASICVTDDGVGFDPENVPAAHLGLGIMRERARGIGAELSIRSEPGRGTQVTVTWIDRSGVR